MKKISAKKTSSTLFKRAKSQKIVFAVVFIIFVVYSFLLMFPYMFAFNASLMENSRVYLRNPSALCREAFWVNYKKAFSDLNVNGNGFFSLTFNSVWYSVGGTLISLTVTTMSTYVIAKYKFWGRNFIYGLVIFTMMLPITGTAASMYRILTKLHLTQSPLYLLTNVNGIMNLYILSFFALVPWDFAEAAFVDGASDWKVFTNVMLPQVLPGLSVLFVSGIIGAWNDYSTPLIYLNDSYPTLASGIFIFQSDNSHKGGNWPVFFAGALIAAVPPVILFLFIQNTLMEKVFIGGIKG